MVTNDSRSRGSGDWSQGLRRVTRNGGGHEGHETGHEPWKSQGFPLFGSYSRARMPAVTRATRLVTSLQNHKDFHYLGAALVLQCRRSRGSRDWPEAFRITLISTIWELLSCSNAGGHEGHETGHEPSKSQGFSLFGGCSRARMPAVTRVTRLVRSLQNYNESHDVGARMLAATRVTRLVMTMPAGPCPCHHEAPHPRQRLRHQRHWAKHLLLQQARPRHR